MELSRRQNDVYNCIDCYRRKNGISPSIADIAKELKLSQSTIATYIEALRRKGKVSSMPRVPRSLILLPI